MVYTGLLLSLYHLLVVLPQTWKGVMDERVTRKKGKERREWRLFTRLENKGDVYKSMSQVSCVRCVQVSPRDCSLMKDAPHPPP